MNGEALLMALIATVIGVQAGTILYYGLVYPGE